MMTETKTWPDLNAYDTVTLLEHLKYLREQRTYKEAANLIIEARTYALRIAAAERMLAIHNRRATEAEDQRAAEERTLTEERVREVVRDDVLTVLEDQSATVTRNNCVLRYGTKERRAALEFCADAIATRAAKELAGATVGQSVLDEVAELREQRNERIAERDALLAQRKSDLREAYSQGWIAGENSMTVGDGGAGPCVVRVAGCDVDASAAEYARSKAGA